MRRRVVLEVVLAAVAVALTASSAQATTHVYVSAWGVTRIDEFRASANGALTQFGNRPENGTNPWYMVMTSNARNLYVDTYTSGKLEAFNVTPTGALTPKTAAQGSSLPTGKKPYALAASPDNRNIYVPNYGASTVSIYDLAADGSAKVHSPSTVPAGAGPSGVAVSRDGNSVYAAAQDGNIYQFGRSGNGGLTAKSPAFVKVKQRSDTPLPDYVVLTPDGKHLYSANYNDSSIGVFDVHADGRLTEKSTGSPVASGYGFYEIAMSPNGKSLYGASNTDGMVYQYSVFPDGSLHPKSPATVAAGGALDSIWLSANGQNAYVANAGTYSGGSYINYDLRQFSIDTAGRLHAMTPRSVATDNYPAAVIVAPDQSPRAAFTSSTAGVHKKQFDATGATDLDGLVTSYVWRFGDGTAALVDGAKPTHKYAHAGTYTVTLRVIDNAGCSVAKIWTGQTAYCGGNPAAIVHHSVSVK